MRLSSLCGDAMDCTLKAGVGHTRRRRAVGGLNQQYVFGIQCLKVLLADLLAKGRETQCDNFIHVSHVQPSRIH